MNGNSNASGPSTPRRQHDEQAEGIVARRLEDLVTLEAMLAGCERIAEQLGLGDALLRAAQALVRRARWQAAA